MESNHVAPPPPIEVTFGDERPDQWPQYRESSVFWSSIIEAEEHIQVPREMAMMCALGAVSIACQGLVDVEMPTGHRVHTPLMLLTLAESGERKTTVQNLFFKAIIAMNRTAMETNQALLEDYQNQVVAWQTEEKAIKSQFTKVIKTQDEQAICEARKVLQHIQDQKPRPPVFPRVLYDDATPQALVKQLHDYAPFGGLMTSEANSIFSGRAVQELDKLNTLWDGGDVIVDRMSRESFILSGARLTLALMTQPSVIERFLSKRGEEARGMGFLARFLVVKPPKMAGKRKTLQRNPLPSIRSFNERIERLLKRAMAPWLEGAGEEVERQVLTFSSEASALWRRYDQGIEDAMRAGQPYAYYTDHASKLMENVTRMAALLHYFEGHEGPITTETLAFSYDVVRKCSTHFQKYLAGEPQVVSDASALARHFLEMADKQGAAMCVPLQNMPHLARGREVQLTLTDLKQFGPNRLRGRENDARLREALHLLEKMGHLERKKTAPGYRFRENIYSRHPGPELRNGVEYRIESLPLFEQQEYYRCPSDRGLTRSSGFYLIRPEYM